MYIHYTSEGRHWTVDKESRHVMFSDSSKGEMVDHLLYSDIHFGFDVIRWWKVNQLCTVT